MTIICYNKTSILKKCGLYSDLQITWEYRFSFLHKFHKCVLSFVCSIQFTLKFFICACSNNSWESYQQANVLVLSMLKKLCDSFWGNIRSHFRPHFKVTVPAISKLVSQFRLIIRARKRGGILRETIKWPSSPLQHV